MIVVDADDGWASINLISASTINAFTVSIDEHPMYVYAVDGRHITPTLVNALAIENGNRYSAMIKLDKAPGDYTIRVASLGINQVFSGFAKLSYRGGSSDIVSHPYINYAGRKVSPGVVFFDTIKYKPFPPIAPAAKSDRTIHLHIDRLGASWKWTLGGKESYRLELEDVEPFLFNPNSAYATNPNLTITAKAGEWIDFIVQVAFPLQAPHPLHKHGNKAFMIGQGMGPFNWSDTEEAMRAVLQFFYLQDPPYRDGFTTLPTPIQEPSYSIVVSVASV